MKSYFIIPVLLVTVLAGCTQLSEEDRALITSASQAAQEAKQQSMRAVEEARQAREEAAAARAAAEKSANKADRIFRQGQNK